MKPTCPFPERAKFGSCDGPIWIPGDFARFVKRLNPRLCILHTWENRVEFVANVSHWDEEYSEENNMEHRYQGHWKFCSRIPINWYPERSIYDRDGRHIYRGWREVLSHLKNLGYITIPNRLGGNLGILSRGTPLTVNYAIR